MKQLIAILSLLVLFSCNFAKKPENFISKEEMIDLLVDMKISNKTRGVKNIKLQKNLNYMQFIYEKYQIDSTQFKENNAYYVRNIKVYEEIYKAVSLRLKDSLEKYENLKRTNDSLKIIKKGDPQLKNKFSKKKKLIKTEVKLKATP